MARPLRQAPGGLVYHVLNRANPRATIFHHPADDAAFTTVLGEASPAGVRETKSFLASAPVRTHPSAHDLSVQPNSLQRMLRPEQRLRQV